MRQKCANYVTFLCTENLCARNVQILRKLCVFFCVENVSFLLHVFVMFKNVTKMHNICYIFCTLFARFFNNSSAFFVQIMRIFCANNVTFFAHRLDACT